MLNLKANKKILIQFITSAGCIECEKTKIILKEIKSQFPKIIIKEVNVASLKGLELVTKFGIMANPAIIINNELFAVGSLNKEKLIKKIVVL